MKGIIDMSTVYFMIGTPCSGKSTYIDNILSNCEIISTDNIIEQIAKENNSTYSEMFDKIDFKKINKEMFEKFKNAVSENKDIVIDRTNMTIKSRKRFLSNLTKNYTKYAISFDVSKETIMERNDKRFKETGKHIPENVIDSMIKSFQQPTKEEGFDYIIVIKE